MGKRVFYGVVCLSILVGGCSSGDDDAQDCTPGVDCDVTLDPPAHGHQFVVGPYPVPEGTEVLRCYWVKVPEDMDVTRIEVKYNPGSHHLDIFSTDYAMPDGDFDCSRPEEWGAWPSEIARGLDPASTMPTMLVGFQNDSVEWNLPDGISYKVHAGQQLMIQSHFANVGTQDTPTERLYDVINFDAAAEPTERHAETLFDEDVDIRLPAHTEQTITRICEFPEQVNLIAMFGHFHSRGVSHRVWTYDPDSQQAGDMIYENKAWYDPQFYTVGDQWDRPIATRAIKMEANYFNFTDDEITWGSYVETNEHFETYAFFYPYVGINWECACHREGEPPPGADQNGDCPLTLP
jgi:hypothetical protein